MRKKLPNTITEMFAHLGAPLNNARWSWGAVTPHGTRIFLRVWQDETKRIDGALTVKLTAKKFYEGREDLGHAERLVQVQLMQRGVPAFLVFCEPKKPVTEPRVLKDFVKDRIFPIMGVVEHDGETWGSFGAPIEVEGFQ